MGMSLLYEPNLVTEKQKSGQSTMANTVNKKSVLVVEDSDDIRHLLWELLEDEGYLVHLAATGEEGILKAQAHQPHLILMDLSLPGINGWEVVRRLRANPQFELTPILALTAHASSRDEQNALAAGCSGYISKPFDMDDLLNRLETMLAKSHP